MNLSQLDKNFLVNFGDLLKGTRLKGRDGSHNKGRKGQRLNDVTKRRTKRELEKESRRKNRAS